MQSAKFELGPLTIELVAGDLARLGERVDVVVSSDDSELSHGGGVSAALWAAAGDALADWRAQHPETFSLGDVVVSPAGALAATHLAHGITVDLERNEGLAAARLEGLVDRLFEVAHRLRAKRLAMPLLASGTAGLGPEASATLLARRCRGLAFAPYGVERVIVVVLPTRFAAAHRVFQETLEAPRFDPATLPNLARASSGTTTAHLRALLESPPSPPAVAAIACFHATLAVLVDLGQRLGAKAAPGAGGTPTASAPRVDEGTTLLGLPDHRLLERARAVLAEGGAPMDRGLSTACDEALQARNRLAHGRTRLDEIRRVNETTDQLLVLAAQLASPATPRVSVIGAVHGGAVGAAVGTALLPGVGTALGALFGGWVASKLGGARDGAPEAGATPPEVQIDRRPEPSLGATEHVVRLQRFIEAHLSEEALQELHRHLEQEGYAGEPSTRLLEYCVREQDPAAFIAGELSGAQLRRVVEKFTGKAPDYQRPAHALAMDVLEHLGFPRPPAQLRGLHAVQRALEQGRARAEHVAAAELKGLVVDAASQLEFAVQVLLRFVLQVAFETTPERFFRPEGRLKRTETLEKCSLGRLLELLELVSRRLEEGKAPKVDQFRVDFSTRGLGATDSREITALRNRFAHAAREDLSHHELVEEARRFFDAALAFVRNLGQQEHRVFPRVIVIESIHVDRWGRRLVRATSDEGAEELIFTREPLEPGAVYYMHPLSNPLRVEPILKPAGALFREE